MIREPEYIKECIEHRFLWKLCSEEKKNIWIMVLVFMASRIIFRLAFNLKFDSTTLSYGWHFADVNLLKTQLMQSCYYLHSTPPLFNYFLGLVLKAFPVRAVDVFAMSFSLVGLTLYVSMFFTLILVGVRRWVAWLASTGFILSPAVVLYENWLFYTYPLAALLVCATFLLTLYLKTSKDIWGYSFFALLSLAGLTASFFHVAFFIGVAGVLAFFSKIQWCRIVKFAVPGILLLLALYLKNFAIFGFFGPSSWTGMNTWRIAHGALPQEHELHQSGTDVVGIPSFSEMNRYPSRFRKVPERYRNIPVLATENKQVGGEKNLNHIGYIDISKHYMDLSMSVIREYPLGYIRQVMKSWVVYFRAAHDFRLLKDNELRLRPYTTLWELIPGVAQININKVSAGFFSVKDDQEYNLSLLRPLGFITLLFMSLWFIHKTRREPLSSLSAIQCAVAVLCLAVVLYIAVLGNSLEYSENNRFRFMGSAMSVLLISLVVGRKKPA